MTVASPNAIRPAKRVGAKRARIKASASAPAAAAERVHAYARAVVSGEIVAGRYVVAACRRHLADLERGTERGLVWRAKSAEAWITFFEQVLYIKEDTPFLLQPFQVFIIGSLFGWYRSDGCRRFRYFYGEMGKGNGKTPLAAGIGLGGLVMDDEHAPEIYSAAAAKEQARICFHDALQMVQASPELRGLVQVLTNSLTVPARYARFMPVSSEDKTHHGKRVHMCVLDEIHAHNTGAVARAMVAGTKNCKNALVTIITNSGSDRNTICWEYHETARQILEGTIEKDDWFCYVCTLDPCPQCLAMNKRQPDPKCRHCDDWQNPATWIKANPGLGTILLRRYLEERVDLAKKMPSEMNDVLQLNFCQWTDTDVGWANMYAWNNRCRREGLRIEDYAGRTGSVAMDAANKVDITSLVVVFEAKPGSGKLDPAQLDIAAQTALAAAAGDSLEAQVADVNPAATLADVIREIAAAGYVCFHRAFVPADMVANSTQRNHELYRQWERAGRLIVTPGARTDFGRIEEELRAWRALFKFSRFSFDPRELAYFAQRIAVWADFPIVEVTQSPQMISQPMKELEALICAGLMGHDGDPVLTWGVGNVIQKTASSGNLTKYYFPGRATAEGKIDPAASLIMALDGALRVPEPQGEPGLMFL